jgi:hypothetical protein
MTDEYLTRCVADPLYKTVRIYSSEGTEKEVTCDTVEEFLNVVKFIRATVDDEIFSYAEPV